MKQLGQSEKHAFSLCTGNVPLPCMNYKFEETNAPIGLVLALDLALCVVSLWFSYLLRFNFQIPEVEIATFLRVFPAVLVLRTLSFLLFEVHRAVVRQTGIADVQRIFLAIAAGSLVLGISNPLLYLLQGSYVIPFSILIIDGFLTAVMLVSLRIGIRMMFNYWSESGKEKMKVIIYGAGQTGITARQAIERDAGAKYRMVSYFDGHPMRIGKKIQGTTVRHPSELPDFIAQESIKLLILADSEITASAKRELIELCLANNTKVFSVPPIKSWINGELSFKQIKKINVRDLLERDPIEIHSLEIRDMMKGKVILVTGAAGSIGSELVKQLSTYEPSKLVLLDQAESPLFELDRELLDEMKFHQHEVVIADITNYSRLKRVFDHYKPQLVFHAAAYKHVPLMEDNPSEALLTNIKGTRQLADLAVEFGVERFIMVSTDKAVNPTNVMGASKRVAERYVQALGMQSKTQFITTRFGNVLGSHGSAIPLFIKQIERGGPITVTHPEITRFFMTIPEACQLVLEAATFGKSGEIVLFDMGKSVKIVDLVRKMVKLYGLQLDKDIQIEFTGLRPGEKLYEELFLPAETTKTTYNDRIMVAEVAAGDFDEIRAQVNELIDQFDQQDNHEIVSRMKALVPEYKSNNSVFEALDKSTNESA